LGRTDIFACTDGRSIDEARLVQGLIPERRKRSVEEWKIWEILILDEECNMDDR